jgi:hypothetical protein
LRLTAEATGSAEVEASRFHAQAGRPLNASNAMSDPDRSCYRASSATTGRVFGVATEVVLGNSSRAYVLYYSQLVVAWLPAGSLSPTGSSRLKLVAGELLADSAASFGQATGSLVSIGWEGRAATGSSVLLRQLRWLTPTPGVCPTPTVDLKHPVLQALCLPARLPATTDSLW